MDPTNKFQSTVITAINDAAQNAVHPAIIYTILGGCMSDVLTSIKKSNRAAQEKESQPDNVTEIPKPDTVN